MTTMSDVAKSLRDTMATHARDWSLNSRDAWLYGVVCGWGRVLPEVAAKHNWSAQDVTRLRELRTAYCASVRRSKAKWPDAIPREEEPTDG